MSTPEGDEMDLDFDDEQDKDSLPKSLAAAGEVKEEQAKEEKEEKIPASLQPLLAADPVLAREYRDVQAKLGWDPFRDAKPGPV